MRLRYFIIILFIVTLLSLIYTWQQVNIIKLAYQENNKAAIYKELLDSNHYLRYNLIKLKSSYNLGNKLLDDKTDFEIPKHSQMLTLVLPKQNMPADKNIFTQPLPVNSRFLKSGIIFLSAFKIEDSLPLSIIKSYINKQAQAEDVIKK